MVWSLFWCQRNIMLVLKCIRLPAESVSRQWKQYCLLTIMNIIQKIFIFIFCTCSFLIVWTVRFYPACFIGLTSDQLNLNLTHLSPQQTKMHYSQNHWRSRAAAMVHFTPAENKSACIACNYYEQFLCWELNHF